MKHNKTMTFEEMEALRKSQQEQHEPSKEHENDKRKRREKRVKKDKNFFRKYGDSDDNWN